MINNDLLKELHQIIQEDYSINLSQSETETLANLLLQFFSTLSKTEDVDKVRKLS